MSDTALGTDTTEQTRPPGTGGTGTTTPSGSVPRTSAAVALVLSAITLGALAVYTGQYVLTGAAVGAGLCLSLAGIAGVRRSRVATAVGSLLFVIAAGLLALAGAVVAVVVHDTFDPLSAPGQLGPFVFVLAVGSVTVGVAGLLGRDSVTRWGRTLTTTALTVCLVVGTAFALTLLAVPFLRGALTPLFNRVVTPSASPRALATFLVLLGTTLLSLGALAPRLPVSVFVRGQRRLELEQHLDSVHDRLVAGGLLCLVAGGLAFVLVPGLWETVPAGVADGLTGVTSAHPLRLGLVGLLVTALLGVGVIEGLRQVQPNSTDRLAGFVTHSLGGVAVLGVLWLLGFGDITDLVVDTLGTGGGAEQFEQYLDEFGAPTVLTGALAGACGTLAAAVFAGAALGYVGLLPTRSPGRLLTAGGLVGTATLAGSLADPSPLLFVTAGAAVTVWDVTTYGHRLALELGHGDRRLELVHSGATGFVSLAIAVLVYGGFVLSSSVVSDAAVVALAALVGLLLLLGLTQR